MVTLKQLRYLDALAVSHHFGRAAERCSVTQPALSMQIRELEKELGLTLVERNRHGAVLTRAGIEIARRAGSVLTAVSDLIDYARQQQGVLAGALALGVIPSIGPYLLPRVLAGVHERYPLLDLSVRETQTRWLVRDLIDARLDLAIVALPIDEPEIAQMALFEDRFLVAVPPGHPLAAGETVPQHRLAREKLLLLEEGHCLRDQALSFCAAPGASRQMEEFGATSLATIVQMVAGGYGITLLPEMALAVEVREPRLVEIRPIDPPAPTRTVGLAWRRTSPRQADFTEFGRLIVETAQAGWAGGGPGPKI